MAVTPEQIAELKKALRESGGAPKKKFGFSKILLLVVSVLYIAVLVFSFILMWRTGDLSPLGYIIPATAAELATATGFYYNKAKRENEIKLRSAYGSEAYKDTKESF